MKNASQSAAAWKASGPAAQSAFVEGVRSTQKDQAALAVAAIPRMVAGFNEAASSGRIAQGLTRRGTAYWRAQAEAKAGNFGTGFNAGATNYEQAAAKFIPAIQEGVNSLPPRGDINTNLDRARSLALFLHSRKGTLGAG